MTRYQRHTHPHGVILGFHLAKLDAEDMRRAHNARSYPKAKLDEADDDYEFVAESLDRWADRQVRDPAWELAKRRR